MSRSRDLRSNPARFLLLFGILALLASGAMAGESLKKALSDGDVSIDLRYRLEHVDQDGFDEDADASTARVRLGYETGRFYDTWAYVDFEVLRSIGGQTYNSTGNGRTQYPVVADPEDEEVNQAFVAYEAPCDTVVKLGRQRIKLGNDRFVGNVGWRQLEQTYDAFTVDSKLGERFTLLAGHINNANQVFGEHNSLRSSDVDLSMNYANVDMKTSPGTLSAYVHYIENESAPLSSHRNIGVRFAGRHELSERTDLLYAAEYADQSDYEDAPSTVDAEYMLAEVGVDFDPWTFKAGLEVLGGDGEYGFQTPLATLHAFQGWADRFVVGGTPMTGIEDLYLTAVRKLRSYKFAAVYHDFSFDEGSDDYGTELDLLVTKSYGDFDWSIKYADYGSDLPSTSTLPAAVDTEIFWFQMHYRVGG